MIRYNTDNLPKRLKEARERKDLNQYGLGCVTGVSSQAISGYESGKNIPSATVLARLAEELDVSVDWLLGREDR